MTTATTDRIEKRILLRASRDRVWRALTASREFGLGAARRGGGLRWGAAARADWGASDFHLKASAVVAHQGLD